MPDVGQALRSIAAGRRDDPLAPVTLIVPSHAAALHLRRRLSESGPFAGVRFETLPRVAELLGAGHLAAAGRAPLARPIGDYLAERVAAESQGVLSRVGDLPGYARVLRQMFRRLRRGGIRGSADVPDAVRTGHLAEVLRRYDRFREETAAFYDEEDLLEAAAEAVRSGRAGALADLGAVYVVPPGAQSSGAAHLLAALREAAPGYVELDEPTAEPDGRFVLAPDPASEAREVVREVLSALSSGLALHEIAVFHGADPAYRRLLREAFDMAGVPVVDLPGTPVAETPAGRGALALALLPDGDFSRTATMDFLSLAPLRDRLPTDDGPVRTLAAMWDRLSRDAGITHGRERWSAGLRALMANREQTMESVARENEGWQRMLAFERDMAGQLGDAFNHLANRLEPLRPEQSATAFIPRFKSLIDEYFDPDAYGLEEVKREIDQLGTVGAVGGSFSLDSFARALGANLEAAAVRERALGEGILVADYRVAAGLRFRHVVLCGAYEGALPAGPGPDALVPDSAWARLREQHPYLEDAALRIQRAREAAQRALVSAGETLVWSAPLYEPGGTREYYPSPMMVAAAAGRDADIRSASRLRGRSSSDWLRRGLSPLTMMLAGPVVDVAEGQVRRAIHERQRGVRIGPGHARWRPLSMLRARRSARFTEWDGNLAELVGSQSLDRRRRVSPTSLEAYGVCGFRYLCRTVLQLNTVEEPEEREMMDAAARGTLIHEVLRAFFEEQAGRDRPEPGEAWTEEDRDRLLEIAEEALADARRRGITGLDIYSEHEMRTIRVDLAAFLEEDTMFRRRTGAVPREFEAAVPEVSIAGVTLRGYVDRVDRSPDGRSAWVIDYKTGSTRDFKEIEKDPLVGGTKLQLPTYLAAAADAEEARAAYWFITNRGGFEFVEYEPTPERQELFQQTLEAIMDGVRGGAFPAVSGELDDYYGKFGNCKWCDFDRICSRRRDYELAAKADDAALGPWLNVGRAARGEDGQ